MFFLRQVSGACSRSSEVEGIQLHLFVGFVFSSLVYWINLYKLFSFPRNNPKVYAQWLKVFGISEVYEKREHPRICEKCFKPECFYEKYPGQNRKSLLPGAVPTNNKKMVC